MNQAMFTLAAVLLAGSALAQTATPGNMAPGATSNAPMTGVSPSTGVTPGTGVVGRNMGTAAAAGDRNQAVSTTAANAPQPARGANSFSMGEARRRIQRSGYTNVAGLKKDDGGVWRGMASKGGAATPVWLDYKGNVGNTADVSSTMGTAPASGAGTPGMATPGTSTTGTRTPGMGSTGMGTTGAGTTGTTMPANPPGTAVTRGIDRTLGTNATGTNPAGTSAISK